MLQRLQILVDEGVDCRKLIHKDSIPQRDTMPNAHTYEQWSTQVPNNFGNSCTLYSVQYVAFMVVMQLIMQTATLSCIRTFLIPLKTISHIRFSWLHVFVVIYRVDFSLISRSFSVLYRMTCIGSVR